MTTVEDINNYLTEVKNLIAQGRVDFIPRPKNDLSILGLTIPHAVAIIGNLTYRNYYRGPRIDDNPAYAGFVWEFGDDETNYQIYIKLKIKETSRGNLLCIMGFHKADFLITYSYK
jgi:hypothetical protein